MVMDLGLVQFRSRDQGFRGMNEGPPQKPDGAWNTKGAFGIAGCHSFGENTVVLSLCPIQALWSGAERLATFA